ncbi:MAG: fibronectin type III domain-containing protein [Planctomycetia bacterium]|nr:fibronectin type III domain-containing protein [Planctomycetia bacterium]
MWSTSIIVDSTDVRSYSHTFKGLASGAGYEFQIRAISAKLPDLLSSDWFVVKVQREVK